MSQQVGESEKVEKILLQLNKTGLSYLKFLQLNEAVDFFKKAEKIVNEELMVSTHNQKINQLAGVTFNNLACYYKKTRKPKVALQYLMKCLDIEVYKVNDWVSTGSTHLNICAIFSYLGKHEDALSHVKLAIQLLDKKHYAWKDDSQEARSYWNIKMLCYYNKAIEEEHLKAYQNSLASFTKAKQIAKMSGSKNVGIILSCDQAISRLEISLAALKKKMISQFMKKKEDDESGHYQFMRYHKPIPLRVRSRVGDERVNRLPTHQNSQERKKISGSTKFRIKAPVIEPYEKRSNSTKFKGFNEYINHRYKTEAGEDPNK